ncbi:MAG: hypothetical protein ACRDYY_07380, partial [Acidimicrobiales bacterium]
PARPAQTTGGPRRSRAGPPAGKESGRRSRGPSGGSSAAVASVVEARIPDVERELAEGAPAPASQTSIERHPSAGRGPDVGPHLRVVPDAEPEAATPAEHPGSDLAGSAGDDPGSQVDVLFARIRAGRSAAKSRRKGASGARGADSGSPAGESEGPRGDEVAGAETWTDADESLLQKREAALLEFEVALTRKLKRVLQDEQNDLLDRLRGLRGEPTAARLLPDRAEQVARYVDAARPFVERAAASGVTFGAEQVGVNARPVRDVGAPQVDDLAEEAASTIVDALRRRLEKALGANVGEEQAVLFEALGTAYREWKSERIERIAGDVLSASFSRGTWHAVPERSLVRWVVEDTDGPCPDCDDDALAGGLPKGEIFPTGQAHPPAHPGCRCLLVPAPN